MNNRMKGYYRDKAIVETVGQYRCLNTDQIQHLIFLGMKSGKRKCQMRLKKLTDKGKLKRWRYDSDEPYAYFVDRVGHIDHTIQLNWFLIWRERNPRSWGDKVHSLDYEQDYGVLRSDAFVAYKNYLSGKHSFTFAEMDRGTNIFDKVKKYNELYSNEKQINAWWKPLTKGFPAIDIITTSSKRLKIIQDAIKYSNKHGLEFNTYLIDEIRKDVLGGGSLAD